MKTASILAAAACLAMARLATAQLPPGVTLEMIASALPEEGAPKARPGAYPVTPEPAFGVAGLKTFRPARLDRFPARDVLPVVVWGNGGCAIDNPRYDGLLTTIASQGFLVVTTTATPGAPPPAEGAPARRATADDLRAAIDWAERENARAGSPLRGKIDTRKVAVMGQSCGGSLSIALGADPRVGTIGVFNSGAAENAMDVLKPLHGPVLLINGHERDFMMGRSKATFDAIDSLPVFYGSRHGAGHTATAYHAGGGEFANVASAWLRWIFKGDRKAGEQFSGEHCVLCTDRDWDVAAKRLVSVATTVEVTARKGPNHRDEYRRISKNGQELFCKREVLTGSRTSASESCLTKAEVDAQADNSQEAMRRIQNYPGQQATPAGNGVTNGVMSPR